jgi:hypothetical protein
LDEDAANECAEKFVIFLETGSPPEGLFHPNVFCDFTMPLWRLQFEGVDELVGGRKHSHPAPGTVPRWRCDPTPNGFVLELEERWHDEAGEWYCREMFRADVVDGAIAELAVYCTGDWDEAQAARHAREVTILRP